MLQSARRRLHRRVRGADPGRLRQPHRQVGVHRAVRVRRDQPRRGAAPDHRGRGDDPLQGRGRHRRRLQRRHPHAHDPRRDPPAASAWRADELYVAAKELQAPYDLVKEVAEAGKLPVVLFTAGGIATPADAAMMMQLGAEGVFVGSGIFKSGNPAAARRGDRQGHHLLRRPRRASPRSPAASARRWSASTSTRSRSRTGSPSAAGEAADRASAVAPRSASSRCRATSASTCAMLTAAGADAVPVRRPSELDAVDGLVLPGRRVDHDGQAGPRPSSCSSRCASGSRDGLPAFGTCAGMIMLADRIAGRHRRTRRRFGGLDIVGAPQRVRPAGRLVRGRPRRRRRSTTAVPRGVHPGAVGRAGRHGRRGRSPRVAAGRGRR